jgi:hypothetical protein
VDSEERAAARSQPLNMLLHHQTSMPLLENVVFSVQSVLRLYIARPIRKSTLVPSVEAGSNISTVVL